MNRWAAPDLVGEISDTTLASDLAEKKQLYAVLGISEYWVIDVRGQIIFLFSLDNNGQYQQVDSSKVLSGLSVDLLEQTLLKLKTMKNTKAASWFQQQIAQLSQMK